MVVREMVWVPASQQQQGSGTDQNNTMSMVETMEQRPLQDSAAAPIKSHLNTLEQEMLMVMRNPALNDSQKLHKYVSLLRSSILYSDKLSKYEQEPVPVIVVQKQQADDKEWQDMDEGESEKQQPQEQQQQHQTTAISSTMPSYVREEILRKFVGPYRERAADLLEQLSKTPQFKYYEIDGRMMIGNKPLSKKANFPELISRLVKEQSGLPVTSLVPTSYKPFKTFVDKMGIKVAASDRPTTSSGTLLTARKIIRRSGRAPSKKTAAASWNISGSGRWISY